jgi:hypothetical protein
MLLNNIYKDPYKFSISVLDAVSSHLLPYNKFVPFLYQQSIQVTPDMFPARPADRSQMSRLLYKWDERPYVKGLPEGKVMRCEEAELHRFICKQYKNKLSSALYHPPMHLVFRWQQYGGEEGAKAAAMQAQQDFNARYGLWRNQYRVAYDELTDAYFLQVKVNHQFSECTFHCDIEDADLIFASNWYLTHNSYKDDFTDRKYRYTLRQRDENGKPRRDTSLPKLLFPDVPRRHYVDNNVFNNRRYNLQAK